MPRETYRLPRSVISKLFEPMDICTLLKVDTRVGTDSKNWNEVPGKHGIEKLNNNGLLLLSKCAEHNLYITNTMMTCKEVQNNLDSFQGQTLAPT